MNKQIVVNVKDFEINVGVLEDGVLSEFFVERDENSRIIGNIYKGRVENVLPGMESAFVNIGLEKNSFLYVNDLREFEEKFLDGIKNSDKPIEEILRKGDKVIVQILKEPRGTKGARVTTHYTIPGKYLVLMPNNDYVGISKKIKDETERERLLNILKDIKPDGVGVIIRTVAEGKDEVYFEREIEYLVKKWQEIESHIKKAEIGEVLYRDNNLLKRIIRDVFSNDINELIIDSEERYWRIMDYIAAFSEKGSSTKIKLYSGDEPILKHYGIESEIKRALDSEVRLDCGGYLVIEKTEALISIDVNTGKNTGVHNLEETVLQTNLEAAREIPRQLRLRNLSGIIIIDFIDMKLEEDKKLLIEELEKNLSYDRIKNNVIHFTDLGLVEMTRKRVGKPLANYFLEPCDKCNGKGYIESSDAMVHEVIEQLKNDADEIGIRKIKLRATEKIYDKIHKLYKVFIESYLKDKEKEFEIEKIEVRNNKLYEILFEK